MKDFELDSRLEGDCQYVLDWPLCRVLLMRDARYPWFILVPRRPDLRELCQLDDDDYAQFGSESRRLSQYLLDSTGAPKLNVAALGNVVAQLHIHHIARFHDDDAWPGPVWGALPARPYAADDLEKLLTMARQQLPFS